MRLNHFFNNRIVVFLPLLLLGLAGTAGAQNIQLRIIVSQAQIRLNPESASTVIGEVSMGMVLEAEKKSGEWYYVSLPPDENNFVISGYVHQDSVEVLGGELSNLRREKEEAARTEGQPEYIPRQPEKVNKQPVPEIIKPRKFYVKGIVGFGLGFDRIPTGIYKKSFTSDEWMEVILLPGGGIGLDAYLGYRFIPSTMLELGIAYQSTGTSVKDTGDEIHFQRYPLSVTLIHEIKSKGKMTFYFGAGAAYYLGPNFLLRMSGLEINIDYKPSPGFHGLIGLASKPKSHGFFYFFEMKFSGIMSYEWEKALVEGIPFIPTDEYAKLTGKGIYIDIGFGYGF